MQQVVIPAKLVGATVSKTFNFSNQMGVGETISTATSAATVWNGTDASPSSIVGSSTIDPANSQQVLQILTAGVVGVTYLVQVTVTTSAAQTLQLTGYLSILSVLS